MTSPLTDDDIADLRNRLAANGRPRVRIRNAAAGVSDTGTVVSVGDPATDGDEYIQVAIRTNGRRDVLPFSPNDLASTSSKPAPVVKPKPVPKSRPRKPQPVTITVATTGDAFVDWTVDVTRGGKVIAKGVSAHQADVQGFVDSLAEPKVTAAIEDIVEASRAEVEARAQQLRAELAEAEAALARFQRRRK